MKVGDRATRSLTITDEHLELFARMSGDRNPLHFDEQFARAEQHLRYTAPVRPGDTITGEVVVRSVREDKPIVVLDLRVTRNDGRVVLEGDATVYVMRPS